MTRSLCLLGLAALAACTASNAHGDASADATRDGISAADAADHADLPCTRDLECSDGVFCTGVERCMPGAAHADARGCLAGTAPCDVSLFCDETMDRCTTSCVDADHDGHRAQSCGGDDCDDSDANRFPGNVEVCDTNHHDEDCNPATFGTQDGDHDSFVAQTCCNVDLNGQNVCGSDCDDTNTSVHPGVPEVCNGIDDNCNGAIDEGVVRTFFPDVDHDNFGDRTGMPTRACSPAPGLAENSLDCNDNNAAVSPVATEVCNGIDDNCDGAVDETPASAFACSQHYGSPANTNFMCTGGTCSVACPGSYLDCDSRFDNGCETNGSSDPLHCGACGTNCGAGGVCTAGHCDTIISISAGAGYSCAVRSSHRAVCWGTNGYGQLGDGTGIDQSTPTVVHGLDNVTSIEAGRFPENLIWHSCPQTCALNGMSLVCWGCDVFGGLGIGFASGVLFAPGPNVIGLPIYDMADRSLATTSLYSVGGGMTMAVESGSFDFLYSWGSNFFNTSPLLQRTGAAIPADPTPGVTNFGSAHFIAISSGDTHACVIDRANGLRCWGQNINGQLGNGSYSGGQYTGVAPVTVAARPGSTGWLDVSAGSQFTCAISNDGAGAGRIFCWGTSGATAPAYSSSPLQVVGPTDAVQIASGVNHACALRADHTAVCWGSNTSGALGDGTTIDSSSAVAVGGLSNLTQISAGSNRTCALTMSGIAYCWGDGAGTSPTRVPGI